MYLGKVQWPCPSSPTRVDPWQAEPYKLWSLLDMLRFYAHAFCRDCGIFAQLFTQVNHGVKPTPDSMSASFGAAKHLIEECERLKLPVTLKQARSLEAYVIEGGTSTQE